MERNGGHEGQAYPLLLWCGLPPGLESDYRTTATDQAGDSEGLANCGLTNIPGYRGRVMAILKRRANYPQKVVTNLWLKTTPGASIQSNDQV